VADDRELWERICRGDTRAFDGFYRENVLRLHEREGVSLFPAL
jgi:hypothetical protein